MMKEYYFLWSFSFLPSVKLSRLSNTSSRLLRRELGLFRRSSTVVSSTTSTFVWLATFWDLFACFGFEGLFSTMYNQVFFLSYLFLICYCHYYRNKHSFKSQQYWAQNIYCFSPNWYLSSVNGFICWKHFVMYIVTLTCNIKNSCYSLLAS